MPTADTKRVEKPKKDRPLTHAQLTALLPAMMAEKRKTGFWGTSAVVIEWRDGEPHTVRIKDEQLKFVEPDSDF